MQIWNHPGILQLRKENRDSAKCEDVENLADDISSDENIDYNLIPGGTLDLFWLIFFSILFLYLLQLVQINCLLSHSFIHLSPKTSQNLTSVFSFQAMLETLISVPLVT